MRKRSGRWEDLVNAREESWLGEIHSVRSCSCISLSLSLSLSLSIYFCLCLVAQVVWFVTCFGVILLGVDKGLIVGLGCAILVVMVQLSRYAN